MSDHTAPAWRKEPPTEDDVHRRAVLAYCEAAWPDVFLRTDADPDMRERLYRHQLEHLRPGDGHAAAIVAAVERAIRDATPSALPPPDAPPVAAEVRSVCGLCEADMRNVTIGCEPCPGGDHYRPRGKPCNFVGCAGDDPPAVPGSFRDELERDLAFKAGRMSYEEAYGLAPEKEPPVAAEAVREAERAIERVVGVLKVPIVADAVDLIDEKGAANLRGELSSALATLRALARGAGVKP